jgi:large subunit ribosomal protein L5
MADKKNEGKAAKDKDKAAPKGGKDGGGAKAPPKDGGGKAKDAKGGKGKQTEADKAAAAQPEKPRDPNYVPRLRAHYKNSVVAALTKRFTYKNPMMVPRLQKVVINMGLGAAVGNPKIIDSAVEDMRAIGGQKPVVTRARKSIATFKLREGLPIGVMVTLRRERMWEFVDRLISFSLPRVRDFKGVSPKGFDGKGNFTMGLREQIIFPEIDYDKIDVVKGLNISFVTTARTDEEGRALLTELGIPFKH